MTQTRIPYCPSADHEGIFYTLHTWDSKIVADYANLSIPEAEQLPLDIYRLYLRDGFINKMQQSKSGMEYLENCWYLEQTEPDRKRLQRWKQEEVDGWQAT